MDEIFVLNITDKNERIEDNLVLKILKTKKYRQLFINQYKFFHENDSKMISEFIESNYNLKINNEFKIDLLNLSCEINYFNKKICDLIIFELKNKKDYLFKLSCLDYLNNFYENGINKVIYIELNEFLFYNSFNKLIKFQSAINLLLKNEGIYENYLLKSLNSLKVEPFFYYRLVNTFFSYKQFDSFNGFLEIILKIIDTTNNLSFNQKEELKSKIISIV